MRCPCSSLPNDKGGTTFISGMRENSVPMRFLLSAPSQPEQVAWIAEEVNFSLLDASPRRMKRHDLHIGLCVDAVRLGSLAAVSIS